MARPQHGLAIIHCRIFRDSYSQQLSGIPQNPSGALYITKCAELQAGTDVEPSDASVGLILCQGREFRLARYRAWGA